ncbi:MAG TPA: dihydrolipoamide acetyltransferase family protein [Pontiellaceae bacterium]|nr:dihydrolipoamide acetyltransferase family protein [Pontiellaceae bacterium]HPR82601.1 dihydrolipoamide acetyltransferase family protein [Pontiellaceae bacterium]
MATEVLMPRQGQSVESCIITGWKVKEGDPVKAGQPLCEVETDKAAFEVEAPAAGTVLGVFYPDGADVPVLRIIAAIGAPGEDISALRPSAAAETKPEAGSKAEEKPSVSNPAVSSFKFQSSGLSSGVSPRARNLAAAEGLDVSALAGSGPEGRVIERDVKAALAGQAPLSPAAKAKIAAIGSGIGGRILAADVQMPSAAVPAAPAVSYSAEQMGGLKEIPVKGVRKVVAGRMLSSLQTTAQLTMHTSADARAVLSARAKFKTSADKAGITINDLVLYAVAQTLVNFPDLNAYWLGDKLVQFENVHLGMAVDTPRGLMVPVIRFANKLSLEEISVEAKRLGRACIKGTIDPDALKGGTFTVTNLGASGIEMFTPVLNAPEAGILGVCSVQPKPVMKKDGGVEFIPHMGLSLTFNHCATDGAPAGRFLAALREKLLSFEIQ